MMKDVGKAARIFLIDDHAIVRAGLKVSDWGTASFKC